MASVRTDWHLGDLDLPDDPAPLDTADMKAIKVTRTRAEIDQDVARTLNQISRLEHYAGVSCELLDREGHRLAGGTYFSCHSCPSYTEHPENPLSSVCKRGRQLERDLDEIDVLMTENVEEELVAALAREREEADELAAAMLP